MPVYTPGPWHANLTTTRISVSSETASVAHLVHCDDCARADALLIASAPELRDALAALHLAVTMRPSGNGGLSSNERIALDRARVALAKATGDAA